MTALQLFHLSQPQPQRLQLYEALGVVLVVGSGVVLECNDAFAVEGVWRLAPCDDDVSFVELETDVTRDRFLCLIDHRAEDLELRREPESVIDGLRDL